MSVTKKPIILHIGNDIKYNHDIYQRLSAQFTFIQPSLEDRQPGPFKEALRSKKYGDFEAIMRPFFANGGEMGRWDRELVPLLPDSVKIFASAGAGYDWADMDVLAEHGILYTNGVGASSEAVADMALYHILCVFRNMVWSAQAAKSGNPELFSRTQNQDLAAASRNPRGHSLGIIGLGNIGSLIARKVYAAFGMDIYYHDIVRKPQELEAESNATYVSDLDEMLGNVDCTVLATPFGGSKVITREKLAKFKAGSRFVNIARGKLVDEQAVVDALKSGHLSAVGLDVFENEPNVHRDLLTMRNASLTSHNAGAVLETQVNFERLAMENIESYLLHGKALTPVNLSMMKK